MMKRMISMLLAILLLSAAASSAAFAQPVRFQKSIPVIAASTLDGQKTSVQSRVIQILGLDENENCILFADGRYAVIATSKLKELFPDLQLDLLPKTSDYADLREYASGNAVLALQRALHQLGYLKSSPDGFLGDNTKQALAAFQAAAGLEATGIADVLVQMLLASMMESEIAVAGISSFDAIRDRVDVDMDPILNSGLLLDYDDISGTGLISNGEELQFDFPSERDIDQYQCSVGFGIQVTEEKTGKAELNPVMLVDCSCFRRPIIREATLKSGDSRCNVPASDLSTTLEGVVTVEHAVFPLDNECAALLSSAEETGELKIRIDGKYQSFDLIIPAEKLPAISQIGRTAVAIGK